MRASELEPVGGQGGYLYELGETRMLPYRTTSSVTLHEFEPEFHSRKMTYRRQGVVFHPSYSSDAIAQWAVDNGVADPVTPFDPTSSEIFSQQTSLNRSKYITGVKKYKNIHWSFNVPHILGMSTDLETETLCYYHVLLSSGGGEDFRPVILDLKSGRFIRWGSQTFAIAEGTAPCRIVDFDGGSINGWAVLNSAGSLSWMSDDNPETVALTDFSGAIPDMPLILDSPCIWQTVEDGQTGYNWRVFDTGSEYQVFWKQGAITSANPWNQVTIPGGCREIFRVIPGKRLEGFGHDFHIVYEDNSGQLRIAEMRDWWDNDTRGFDSLIETLPQANEFIPTDDSPIAITRRPSGHMWTDDYLYISFCTHMFQSHGTPAPDPNLTDWTEYQHPVIVRIPRTNSDTTPTVAIYANVSRHEIFRNGPYNPSGPTEGDSAPRSQVTLSIGNIDCKVMGGGAYFGCKLHTPTTSPNITKYCDGYTFSETEYTDGLFFDDYTRYDVQGEIQIPFERRRYLNGFTTANNFDVIFQNLFDGTTPSLSDPSDIRNEFVYPIAPNLYQAIIDRSPDFGRNVEMFYEQQVLSDTYGNIIGLSRLTSDNDGDDNGSTNENTGFTTYYSGVLGSDGQTTIMRGIDGIDGVGYFFTRSN